MVMKWIHNCWSGVPLYIISILRGTQELFASKYVTDSLIRVTVSDGGEIWSYLKCVKMCENV